MKLRLKLLVLADIHGSLAAVEKILQEKVITEGVDAIVVAGDIAPEPFTIFLRRITLQKIGLLQAEDIDSIKFNDLKTRNMQLKSTEKIIQSLLTLDKPLLNLFGNEDLPSVADYLEVMSKNEKRIVPLHNRKVQFEDYKIVGFGGASTKHQIHNQKFHLYSEDEVFQGICNLLTDEKPMNTILVTHGSPADIILGDSTPYWAYNMGSRGIRKAIEQFQPLLSLCGHLHIQCVNRIGSTTVINPGALAYFKYALVEIAKGNKIKVQLGVLPHSLWNLNLQHAIFRSYWKLRGKSL